MIILLIVGVIFFLAACSGLCVIIFFATLPKRANGQSMGQALLAQQAQMDFAAELRVQALRDQVKALSADV